MSEESPERRLDRLMESIEAISAVAEMAAAPASMKGQRFYHGTKTQKSADHIWKDGILPDLSQTPKDNVSRPVAGRVYLATNVKESIPYLLGGAMAGQEIPAEWIKKDGQYGYLFVISGASLGDVQPDEDQVGQAVHDRAFPWIDEYLREVSAEEPVYDEESGEEHRDLLQQVDAGEYAGWIKAGHVLLPLLSDEEKYDVMKKYGNIAHEGKVMPVEMWQFDKRKSEDLKDDGSNFFQLAKKIAVRQVEERLDSIMLKDREKEYKILQGREVTGEDLLREAAPKGVDFELEDDETGAGPGFVVRASVNGEEAGSVTVYNELLDSDCYAFSPYEEEPFHDQICDFESVVDIQHLQVDEKYRGKGIAKELMARAMKEIKKRWGGEPVYINASPMGSIGLSALVDFYKSFGFTELKRYPEHRNALLWMGPKVESFHEDKDDWRSLGVTFREADRKGSGHWDYGVEAVLPSGEVIGSAKFKANQSGTKLIPVHARVVDKYQRIGIGTEMYRWIERTHSTPITNKSSHQTPAAQAFWVRRSKGFGKRVGVESISEKVVYHGTPKGFDKFSLDYAGSTQGTNIAWGLYFSEVERGAAFYKKLGKDQGRLYQVKIPDGPYLDWDLSLSKQPKIQKILKDTPHYKDADKRAAQGGFLSGAQLAGREYYGGLSHYQGMDPREASAYLLSLGIRGVKYKHDDYSNYILFNADDAKITKTVESKFWSGPAFEDQQSESVVKLKLPNGLDTKVLKNPTPTQAEKMFLGSKDHVVRGFVSPEWDLYMWDAYDLGHSDFMDQMGYTGPSDYDGAISIHSAADAKHYTSKDSYEYRDEKRKEVTAESQGAFGFLTKQKVFIPEARTKDLKIDGQSVEAILMAGGPGFKIYAISDSVVVVAGRKQLVVKETEPDFKTVMQYVNLKYQPISQQDSVKKEFDAWLKKVGAKQEEVYEMDPPYDGMHENGGTISGRELLDIYYEMTPDDEGSDRVERILGEVGTWKLTDIPVEEINFSAGSVASPSSQKLIKKYMGLPQAQTPPVILDYFEHGGKSYEIVDGFHRLAVAVAKGLPTIKAYVPA